MPEWYCCQRLSIKKQLAATTYFWPTRAESKNYRQNAIDVNSVPFINRNDAIVDLVALNFGVVRCAVGEQWHFECTDLRVSQAEQKVFETEKR